MKPSLSVAAVQLTSTRDVQGNLERAVHWIRQAAAAGAELIALPENFGFLGGDQEVLGVAQAVEDGPFTAPLRTLARELGVSILAGSIPELGPGADKVYNTSVLIGPDGATVARYRKIHLFDVDLGEDNRYQESRSVAPGSEPTVVQLHGWGIGLSVCYDLRFPELYRLLSAQGAHLLCVPAAFTLHTGKDHWEPLLRARAIENACFVVAPAQFGRHEGRRMTWGKSIIIDPWGTPLAMAPEREGFVMASCSAADQERVRRELPCLSHRRL